MTASAVAKFLANPDPSTYSSVPSPPSTKQLSPRAFGLRVLGDSMTNPRYPAKCILNGATVIVDPDRQWRDGDRVLARKDGCEVLLVKQIRRQGEQLLLCSLNPKYQPIKVTPKIHVLGVVAWVWTPEELES